MDINTKDFFEKLIKYFKLVLQMRNSKTGTDIDYIISPVRNKQNEFLTVERKMKNCLWMQMQMVLIILLEKA